MFIITRQKSHFVWSTYCSTPDVHGMGKVHIIEQEQDRIQSVVFPGLALFPCPVTQEKIVTCNFSISVSSTPSFRVFFLSR